MQEPYEKITINIKQTTFKDLKSIVLMLKNSNQTGKVYKTATREEIAQLIRVMLEQKEFTEGISAIAKAYEEGKKQNGN